MRNNNAFASTIGRWCTRNEFSHDRAWIFEQKREYRHHHRRHVGEFIRQNVIYLLFATAAAAGWVRKKLRIMDIFFTEMREAEETASAFGELIFTNFFT